MNKARQFYYDTMHRLMEKSPRRIQKLLGYCPPCGRAFVYPKRRRLNTMYENEESNYITCCEDCYKEAYDYYEELWADYYSGRL